MRTPNVKRRHARRPTSAFSLVELLVVLGIVALLVALLLPALNAARRQSLSLKCKANLSTNYKFMIMYANDNKGWWAPPDLGALLAMHHRWPVYVFPQKVGDPPTMLCPADVEPLQNHSYVLNNHVLDKKVRLGTKTGRSSSDIVLRGEKKSDAHDYYMQYHHEPGKRFSDFDGVVELYRHGLTLGSNYLMMDGSVATKMPSEAAAGLDPWDLTPDQTTTAPDVQP